MPLLQNGNNKNLSNLSKTFQNEMKIAFTWIQSKLQRTDELVPKAFQSIYVEILERFHCTIDQCYSTGQSTVGILCQVSPCSSDTSGTLFLQSHLLCL